MSNVDVRLVSNSELRNTAQRTQANFGFGALDLRASPIALAHHRQLCDRRHSRRPARSASSSCSHLFSTDAAMPDALKPMLALTALAAILFCVDGATPAEAAGKRGGGGGASVSAPTNRPALRSQGIAARRSHTPLPCAACAVIAPPPMRR